MSKHEKDLWRAVVDSVDPGVAGYYDDRITYLCTRFREFEPISVRTAPLAAVAPYPYPMRCLQAEILLLLWLLQRSSPKRIKMGMHQ